MQNLVKICYRLQIISFQKSHFGAVWWFPRIFFVRERTVVSHLYSRFHPNPFRFGELITKKPARDLPKWKQGFFEPIISTKSALLTRTHARLTALFSGTTQMSWYQKGKNQSGFYWSKRQWLAVASAGQYKSLHLAPDRQPHQHPTTLFLQARCPSCRPTNSVKALKATEPHNIPGTLRTSEFRAPLISAT